MNQGYFSPEANMHLREDSEAYKNATPLAKVFIDRARNRLPHINPLNTPRRTKLETNIRSNDPKSYLKKILEEWFGDLPDEQRIALTRLWGPTIFLGSDSKPVKGLIIYSLIQPAIEDGGYITEIHFHCKPEQANDYFRQIPEGRP